MNRRAALLFVAFPLAFAACTQTASHDPDAAPMPTSGQPICTDEFRAGIVVEVRDAKTGLPAADGATGTVTDGAFVDPLMVEGALPPAERLRMGGAWERPGTYVVAVSKEGYLDWSMSDVVVTADECHVQPVHLRAALEPAP